MADITTAIPSYPLTQARPVPVGLDKELPHPGLPRANKAVSKETPHGSPNHLARPDYTVMQQHVAFFDRDNDGVLWPWDTYIGLSCSNCFESRNDCFEASTILVDHPCMPYVGRAHAGFRRLGFGRLISLLAVPFIHGSFSYPTSPSILPDPFFRIYMKNMHRCKHGSDSEVYDTEGRFVPEKFEELFSKYDKEGKGGLSWENLQDMILANMNIVDPVGWVAERLEWWTFYLLAADDNGIISKEKIRGQYDGSLWYRIADELENKKAAHDRVTRKKWQ